MSERKSWAMDTEEVLMDLDWRVLEERVEALVQKTMKDLTELEQKAYRSALESSDGNGHNFGYTEDIVLDLGKEGIDTRASGALITSLVKKGLLEVNEAVTTDSGTWHQFYANQFRDNMIGT